MELRRFIQKIEIWFRRYILKRTIIEIKITEKELREALTSREAFDKFLNTLNDRVAKEIKKGGDSNIQNNTNYGS